MDSGSIIVEKINVLNANNRSNIQFSWTVYDYCMPVVQLLYLKQMSQYSILLSMPFSSLLPCKQPCPQTVFDNRDTRHLPSS